VPVQGLNGLTLSYYLNHADGSKPNAPKPNMVPMQCHCPVMCFYATRDIRAGEELLFDYVSGRYYRAHR
jgi:SET domain-containing protein